MNKIYTKSFSKQIDNYFKGIFPKRDMLIVRKNTPKLLQKLGLKNLPITMTQKHLETIVNNKGPYKNVNYHGINIKTIKKVPKSLEMPLFVLKSYTKSNSIVVVTKLFDEKNRPIIASIKINGKGTIRDLRINTNVMTSVYGKDNFNNFLEKNIIKENILYDKNKGIIKKIN